MSVQKKTGSKLQQECVVTVVYCCLCGSTIYHYDTCYEKEAHKRDTCANGAFVFGGGKQKERQDTRSRSQGVRMGFSEKFAFFFGKQFFHFQFQKHGKGKIENKNQPSLAHQKKNPKKKTEKTNVN